MKKFLAGLLTFCLLGLNFLPALAADNAFSINDVSNNYWAQKQIYDVVQNKIMTVNENGCFRPDESLTRVEFTQALLKVLSNDHLNVNIQNSFSDVRETYPAYADILRSQQLGLVYGYPDGTFKPERALTKAETTSILSHITKEQYTNLSILDRFSDKNDIPVWALKAYAKTTFYGLYVNYPNQAMLQPNREITRAEAAVLLSKLRGKLCIVKEEYKGKQVQEKVISVEHLSVHKKAPVNTVSITNLRKVICENNVLAISFECKFFSKTAHAGDVVNFVLKENLYTDEGTLLLPANTKFVAEVIKIESPKWFNKNARVNLAFRNIVLPDCRVIPFCAKPFTKDGKLKEGPWMTAGKLTLSTLTMGILGAGAGVGFAFIPNPAKIGAGLAIGIPVGCGVGLATGLITKGLHYKAKSGEQIFIILTTDTSIYN